MQFIKVLGLLSFLISGNLFIASSVQDIPEDFVEDIEISSEYLQDFQEPGSSILSGVSKIPALPVFQVIPANNYSALSAFQEKQALDYIISSTQIDPGLDVLEIIYPFHSFF